MTQDLRDVLQQLHTALANLNTFLETQNQQTTTRGENVGTYHDTSSLPELDEWERLHTLGEAQLQEIRDEFFQMVIQENETPGLQRRYEGFSFFPDTELVENLTDDIKPLNGTLSNDQLQLIKDLWPKKLRRRLVPTYKSDSLGYPIECPLTGPPGPGRVIIFRIKSGIIELDVFAFLCSWLQVRPKYININFILQFAKPWGRLKSPYEDWYDGEFTSLWIEHHLHCCQRSYDAPQNRRMSGILVERERIVMRDPQRAGRSPELHHVESLFDEKKWSLCLQIVRTSRSCAYTLLILYDGSQWGSDDLKGNGLVPCGKAVGIFHFQAMLCAILDAWYDNWTEVLDSISKVVGIELNNSQNEKCWDEFMSDTSSRLSRLYFTVIQLFRLMTEWIEESASEIDQLKRKFREIRYEVRLGLSANEIASVEKNWDTISSKMNLLAERLYSRIHRKQEEIKSLRDGLLNATSLRDAGRATALNRAIYIFTAVTIIYTPLGFMAAFWALPALNSSSNNESAISWKAFISTFVLIPALTYIICPIAVWYFSLESSQKSLYSENIHKIQLDLRKRIRDKATIFSHKIKRRE